MSLIIAIIFGILQGATEFLPVSSSAHLAYLGAITKMKEKDALLFFITLHFGTLLALILFFFKDITLILRNSIKGEKATLKLNFNIFLTTLFTGIIGIGLKNFVENSLESIVYPSSFLLLTTILLFSSKFLKEGEKNILVLSPTNAILIGIAQGIAVFPGISRSGSTIFASLCVGLKKKDAFDYSFLSSIPAIGGAFLMNINELKHLESTIEPLVLIVSFFIALFVGLISLYLLKNWTIKGKLYYFGYYTLFISIIGFVLFLKLKGDIQ